MDDNKSNPPSLSVLLFAFCLPFSYLPAVAVAGSIGVNYGTVADNLPPASQVAAFLKEQTYIDKVKLFDANPDIIRAFANTGIALTVSAANADIPSLAKLPAAQAWVAANILPFYPNTTINRIAVGNEVLYTNDKTLIVNLLRAMRSLDAALKLAGVTGVEVSSPHALSILYRSEPPSLGRFRPGYDTKIFRPMLEFHRRTGSAFMVNPYPFFGFTNRTLNYALFRPNDGLRDPAAGVTYTNMFDAQMDAVYAAMNRLGYGDVKLVVAETGWPSVGDPGQFGVSMENAISYNANLVKHVTSGLGTPMMPNRTFDTYIFSLFNEDLKPTTSERNFGLFRPDLTAVYDVGVLRSPQSGGPDSAAAPAPAVGKVWCMPKPGAGDDVLQANIDYVCGLEDCKAIQSGGSCYDPNTVRSHASYTMNLFYQTHGRSGTACDFAGTGLITSEDPSYQACTYIS